MMLITVHQIRAARALLDWSQSDLAEKAGLSQTGIARIENGTNRPNTQTLDKIFKAFERNKVEFIASSGVKKRTDEVRTLTGEEGLKDLVDDIYLSAQRIHKTTGSAEAAVYLYNARPLNWHKWLGKDWWDMHSERMSALGEKVQRIITSEGDNYYISGDFSEHRCFPTQLFNDQSIYAYDGKLAFVTFGEDLLVNVLENPEFSNGFRVLFEIAWDNVAQKI